MSPRAAVAMAAIALGVGWNAANVGAIAEAIARDYAVALATVGLFTTAFFVAHSLVQLPGGKLIDAIGARRVGLAALLVIIATNCAMLVTPDPALTIAMRVVCGLGTGCGFIATSDYVRATGGSAFMQGVFGGVAVGAGGLALAVVPAVENALGWRAPFVTSVVLAALALIVFAAGPRPRIESPGARGAVSIAAVVSDPRLYPLALLQVLGFGLAIVSGNWASTLLIRAGDYGEETAGAIASLILLCGVVTRPLGGWLARAHPDRLRLGIAAALAGGAGGTVLVATAGPILPVVLGAVLLGLCAGIPFAPALSGAARLRPDAPAAAVALVNMSGAVAIVVGTPLLGLAFSLPGDGRVGFVVVAGLWLAGLAVLPSRSQLGLEHGALAR